VTFAEPRALVWMLSLLPLLAVACWALAVARRRRERLFGPMADALAPGFSAPRRLGRDGLALLALALVIVALAGPQIGTSLRKIEERGVDVMVVLDTSRSMLADDMRPTRLERAKREIRGLLDNMVGDRVGLVAFSGDGSKAPFNRWIHKLASADRIVFKASDNRGMEDAIVAGAGLGFMSGLELRRRAGLVEILPPRPDWCAPLWLVTHVDLHRTVKVQTFLSFLKEKSKDWDTA